LQEIERRQVAGARAHDLDIREVSSNQYLCAFNQAGLSI
jgi:hypothetical protein